MAGLITAFVILIILAFTSTKSVGEELCWIACSICMVGIVLVKELMH